MLTAAWVAPRLDWEQFWVPASDNIEWVLEAYQIAHFFQWKVDDEYAADIAAKLLSATTDTWTDGRVAKR